MLILLMVLTIIASLLLFGVLAGFLVAITQSLDSIGRGGSSSLARITWGVRAIEAQTALIAPQVTQLNQGLTAAAAGLESIDRGLVAIASSAAAQGGPR